MANNWYPDSRLASFVQALVNAEQIEDTEDLVLFVTKPQAYDEVYAAWEDNGSPSSDEEDGWDDFITAITDDDDSPNS